MKAGIDKCHPDEVDIGMDKYDGVCVFCGAKVRIYKTKEQKMKTAIVKVISSSGRIEERAFEYPCQLEFDEFGDITKLKPKQYCKTCGGSGGCRYWYAQDHSITVDCPVCNGGDKEEWNREKEAWKKSS